MNEVQNMDESHRNLLNIWVFDKRGNLLGFGENGKKNYSTKVASCSMQDIKKSSIPS
jgi:hypothetical protein